MTTHVVELVESTDDTGEIVGYTPTCECGWQGRQSMTAEFADTTPTGTGDPDTDAYVTAHHDGAVHRYTS